MIEAWLALVQINCTEPKLKYKAFYSKIYGTDVNGNWIGQRGEGWDQINQRLANGLSEWTEYSDKYHEQCGHRK